MDAKVTRSICRGSLTRIIAASLALGVVIIVIVIVVLMLVVMAKTKADFARAVDGATKGTQNVELRKMPPPE